MNNELLDKINGVLDELKTSPKLNTIKNLNRIIEEKYSNELKSFNEAKTKYEAVMVYGRYHPDYQNTLKTFVQKKENLYNKEEVKKYFLLLNEVREDLQSMIDQIALTISPQGFLLGGNICVTK